MTTVRLAVLTGAIAASTPLPAAAQPPADDVSRVVGQWERRRQEVPAVRYVVRWEEFPTGLGPGDPKPGEAGAFTGSGVVTLDPPNDRLRVDRDELLHFANRRERLGRVRSTVRYDGREQFTSLAIDHAAAATPPDPAYGHVEIVPAGHGGTGWPDEFDPLLWGHGLVRAHSDTSGGASPFGWRAERGRFLSGGRDVVGDRPCVVLRDTAAAEGTEVTLWVDSEHGGVVRRRATGNGGRTGETMVTYRETAHGRLPSAWVMSAANPGRQPVVVRRVRVESVNFDPPVTDEDYRIALRPGMEVYKPGRLYRVGGDGSLGPVDAVAEAGLRPKAFPGRLADAVLGVGWPGLVGLVVVVLLAGVLVRLRRNRTGLSMWGRR